MSSNLKRKIMAHVYLEYTKNIFLGYPDYFMLGLFVIVSFTMVSVRDVFINMPKSDLLYFFSFFKTALLNTSWIIQILIAGFLVRTAIAGIMSAYKNIGARWSLARSVRLKY